MSEVIEGIGAAQRERIAALRGSGGFFWIDVPLGEASGPELGAAGSRRSPARASSPS